MTILEAVLPLCAGVGAIFYGMYVVQIGARNFRHFVVGVVILLLGVVSESYGVYALLDWSAGR